MNIGTRTHSARSRKSAIDGLLITVPSFSERRTGVRHFFGTRHSRVEGLDDPDSSWSFIPYRGAASLSRVGPKPNMIVSVKQVHGTDVLVVDGPSVSHDQSREGWDALVTNRPHVLLTIRTADCVPVLLFDYGEKAIGAVHAGWRGAVGGIVPKTVRVLRKQFGSEVGRIRMAIGPSVGPCCYEVDEPVLQRLRDEFSDWPSVVREVGRNRAMLDLRNLVKRQAISLGIHEKNISVAGACTACHRDLFFSYRREGTVRGTMVSGIMLSKPACT